MTTRKIESDIDILHDIDIIAELDIPEGQETDCMRKQPGLYGWYAVLASKAKKHRESLEAELSLQIRDSWSGVKTTEPFVEALIREDVKWQKARETELILGDLRDAFAQRKDMLQSIGATLRTELAQNVSILQKTTADTINKRIRR